MWFMDRQGSICASRSEAFSDIMEEAEAEGQDESASLDFAILHLDISRDRLFSIEWRRELMSLTTVPLSWMVELSFSSVAGWSGDTDNVSGSGIDGTGGSASTTGKGCEGSDSGLDVEGCPFWISKLSHVCSLAFHLRQLLVVCQGDLL